MHIASRALALRTESTAPFSLRRKALQSKRNRQRLVDIAERQAFGPSSQPESEHTTPDQHTRRAAFGSLDRISHRRLKEPNASITIAAPIHRLSHATPC